MSGNGPGYESPPAPDGASVVPPTSPSPRFPAPSGAPVIPDAEHGRTTPQVTRRGGGASWGGGRPAVRSARAWALVALGYVLCLAMTLGWALYVKHQHDRPRPVLAVGQTWTDPAAHGTYRVVSHRTSSSLTNTFDRRITPPPGLVYVVVQFAATGLTSSSQCDFVLFGGGNDQWSAGLDRPKGEATDCLDTRATGRATWVQVYTVPADRVTALRGVGFDRYARGVGSPPIMPLR